MNEKEHKKNKSSTLISKAGTLLISQTMMCGNTIKAVRELLLSKTNQLITQLSKEMKYLHSIYEFIIANMFMNCKI